MIDVIPVQVIRSVLDSLNMTGTRYWHLQLAEVENGEIALTLPKAKSSLPLSPYALQINPPDASQKTTVR